MARFLPVCVCVAIALSVFSAAPGEPVTLPAAAGEHAPTIAQFLKIRVPGQVEVAPNGDIYTRDFPDGIFQLYRRPANSTTAEQGKKLTSYPDGLSSYTISPDGRWVLLSFAAGGNENTQISVLDAWNDQITPLLADPKVQFGVQAWLRDGSGFIYSANDASPRDFYLYKYDLKDRKSTLIWSKPGQWSCADMSNDGNRALISEFRSISDSSVYELDIARGEVTELTPKSATGATSYNTLVGYTVEEDFVFFSSDFENGFVQLYLTDLGNPAATPRSVLSTLSQADLDDAKLNHQRTLLATVHNASGFGALRVFRQPDMHPELLGNLEPGVVELREIQGMTVVYAMSNARTPGFTYGLKLNESSRVMPHITQLTTRLDQEPIALSRFKPAELVTYPSFDGRPIPAFLYLPEGAAKGTPIPFVVNFHGGPESQFRPGFDRLIQYLVSKGYGVLQPNVRGSTGYGREFHMLDNYKNRWDSVKDGVEAARWLIKEGYAQSGKIAAYGGSYGGFMAVATIIEGADVFGASVNVVGIVNMKTFLERTSGYRQKLREAEYGPLSDPAFLDSVSPINRANEIRVPMLIAHGANDPRVPVAEAMQLAVALQKRGHNPELMFFPDEGHGFAKLENRILFSERMVEFLKRHIGEATAH